MNIETSESGGRSNRTTTTGGSIHGGRAFTSDYPGYVGLGSAIIGFGAGMLAMYFLDPERGARRRALLGDRITSGGRWFPEAASATARDMSNRALGTWSEATKLFSSDNPSDQIVEARVRSKMGRVIAHPHAVHVTSRNGNVTLDGVILAREVPELVKCVISVSGVKTVDCRLKEYNSPQGVPSLQGGSVSESRSEFMQQNWSPTTRVAAGAAGTAALAYGLAKRDAIGIGLSAAGAALLARSATNIEFQRLFGFGGGRTAVTIDKSINVGAPPDVVYALWSNFENFPQFMTNVLEVRNIDGKISHWKIAGPAGVPVEWDAEITKIVPEEMIAWKSVEDSAIANAGYVLFEPNDQGGTEVTVRISYNPPGGAVGYAVARAFGADPKTELDADMMRMKSLLETGQIPRDASERLPARDQRQQIH